MQVSRCGNGLGGIVEKENNAAISAQILFDFLRDVIYAPEKAALNINELHEDLVQLGQGLAFLAECIKECSEFSAHLAKGNIKSKPPSPQNVLAGPLKSLHASLNHLNWQSAQVAKGDYNQRVDYMGEFAASFNSMVEQLADRQQRLENEIIQSQKNAKALESSNQLMTSITKYIPQQIFVIDTKTHDILHVSEMARDELKMDAKYLHNLLNLLPEKNNKDRSIQNAEVRLDRGSQERYFSVNSYTLQWEGRNAEALIVFDITTEKNKFKTLESRAFRDSMTNLYNRYYGMAVLNEWIEQKKCFSLVFIDLNDLKYINDSFGHNEGDNYIISVANCFSILPSDTVACRIGGDEFLLLFPNRGYGSSRKLLAEYQKNLQELEYLKDKDFSYVVSYGIVAVYENSQKTSGQVMHIADERMYEDKRERKRNRLQIQN